MNKEKKLPWDSWTAQFSFFNAPVTNKIPTKTMTLNDAYLYISGPTAKDATDRLRSIKDHEEARRFKAKNFAYATFSGMFDYCCDQKLNQHSGLICLDFDHVHDVTAVKEKIKNDKFFPALLMFTSPSGDGVKDVVQIDLSRCDHRTWFMAIKNYMKATYQLEVDGQCANVSRACFLPHDCEAYINPLLINKNRIMNEIERDEFDPIGWANSNQNYSYKDSEQLEHKSQPANQAPYNNVEPDTVLISHLADLLVNLGKNIAEDYNDWVNLGFALADGLGEGGRSIFHRLSGMSSKYQHEKCNQKYDNCLRSHGHGITYRTFFQMAKNAGVDLSQVARDAACAESANVQACTNKEKIGKSTDFGDFYDFVHDCTSAQSAQSSSDGLDPNCGRTFSDKIKREDLPSFLHPIWDNHENAVDRDKMLLGALNIISGMLPDSLYGLYDKRIVYSPLFNIIYGSFATSKGDLESVRHIADPFKKEMKQKFDAEFSEYEKKYAQWESQSKKTRGPEPKAPTFSTPFIPANSSTSAVYRALDANGGWGLMFETEADTMTNMIANKEYGDYSDSLRRIGHHETISMSRVSDKTYIEIEKPRLSVLLTCTGSQMPLLLSPKNVGNGLASRFLIYALPKPKLQFRAVFDIGERALEDVYKDMGQKLVPLVHALRRRPANSIQFTLSKAQEDRFCEEFGGMLLEQYDMMGDGIQGYIFRLAYQTFRTCMTLGALRRLSDWNGAEEDIIDENEHALTCDDRDYNTAIEIVNCLVNHTARVFSVLGGNDNDPFSKAPEQPSAQLKAFYEALPSDCEFQTAQALEIGLKRGVKRRTVMDWLGSLSTKYQVLARLRQGVYKKINVLKDC